MLNKKTETRLRRAGKAVIIDLVGDVTNQGQETIKNAYAEALQSASERVFFNFGDTEYINTSGIAVLISIVMEAEKAGRKIGLFGMSAHYHKVFTLVRLPLYADMYRTEGEALAALSPPANPPRLRGD
jgi:anti-anti-sigma factor